MRPLGEEHMLGAAQADALGAEVDRLLRVARVVGVGLDVQAAGSVYQPMRRLKFWLPVAATVGIWPA